MEEFQIDRGDFKEGKDNRLIREEDKYQMEHRGLEIVNCKQSSDNMDGMETRFQGVCPGTDQNRQQNQDDPITLEKSYFFLSYRLYYHSLSDTKKMDLLLT